MRITRVFIRLIEVLICGIGASAALAAAQPPDPTLRIAGFPSASAVNVEVRNGTSATIPIWKDTNSWGAARWRILILRAGRLVTCYQSPNLAFTGNSPAYIQIAPESNRKHILDLKVGRWLGDQKDCGSFESGDTVIVVYDVPPSREAEDFGVWFGVAATSGTVP